MTGLHTDVGRTEWRSKGRLCYASAHATNGDGCSFSTGIKPIVYGWYVPGRLFRIRPVRLGRVDTEDMYHAILFSYKMDMLYVLLDGNSSIWTVANSEEQETPTHL